MNNTSKSNSAHLGAFLQLDDALYRHRQLWREQLFSKAEPDWRQQQADLYHALQALSDAELDRLTASNEQLALWFSQYLPELCQQLFSFQPAIATASQSTIDTRDNVSVPGRKWQQITAFSAAIHNSNQQIVDWCAGKGHLARVLSRQLHTGQSSLTCLEFDPALCESGRQLANKRKAPLQFIQHDVTDALPAALSGADFHHIGLHACGKLHLSLLKQACEQQALAIDLAPCCYHKVSGEHYRALSPQGQASRLILTKSDLHLPQEETVTAGQRVRRLRVQEQSWRLGFDQLQMQLRGTYAYQPVPSINKQIFSGSFVEFCQWAASTCGLQLNEDIDYARFLAEGEQRRRRVVRLELLRLLFKRPLEYWLLLDRALFLEQQGYRVKLQQFCPRHITPRNILISARR